MTVKSPVLNPFSAPTTSLLSLAQQSLRSDERVAKVYQSGNCVACSHPVGFAKVNAQRSTVHIERYAAVTRSRKSFPSADSFYHALASTAGCYGGTLPKRLRQDTTPLEDTMDEAVE